MNTINKSEIAQSSRDAFEIEVPASIANLGPGFDTLAVAVQLYLRLRVRRIEGHGRLEFHFADHDLQGENSIEHAYRKMAGTDFDRLPSLSIEVRSEIPMRAGLGSSAAATVAGMRLYEAMTEPRSNEAMLQAACELESHPDNAAAALLGGLTASCQFPDGAVRATNFRWPQSLAFVVLTPEFRLTTCESRSVLPTCVPRTDVVFNLQRLALLLQSLESRDLGHLKQALRDRLHQPFRQKIVPGLKEILELEHPDLLGVCLSGSGPSMVAIAERNLPEIAELLASTYDPLGVGYQVRTLRVHPEVSKEPTIVSRASVLCS